jgi:hypothetical protein
MHRTSLKENKMAIWQSQDGALHDDGEGAALSLSSWPQGMTQLTDANVSTRDSHELR